ncbi:vesicle-associated protein 1-2-like isoform X1 [Phragmites australis]|uniref:vesicle-associated protein 1-2-like isoform X1 n=1 Tax=Phragmites australis TaxID=29695 RepID=UPI002D7702B5|nr:vesicle-associated protein 1-2-like isoform X1 [Phragmites australis]
MAASCDLLDVDPAELQFPFVLDKQISCPLRLTNRTDSTVAFKVKTTSPRKYCVRPNSGVVLPRSCCTVVVTMQAQTVAPPDLQCKDKFLVQSVVVSDSAKDITSQMFMKEGGNVVEEVKLKVTYVMPPEPPSEIAEEHDGLERILVPMQRIVDNGRSTSELSSGSVSLRSAELGTEVGSPVGRIVKSEEFLKAPEHAVETKTYAGPAEQSHQLSALVAKLTEEKNSALEQNRKLREELELVRREVNKRQEGFSLVLVLVVGMLSIILGYLVKK